MQFYFLSIFFNMLVGLSLSVSGFKFAELFPGKEKIVKIIVGVAAAVVGFLKFIFVSGDSWYVTGDFLPAIVGIAGGLCYIIDSMDYNTEEAENPKVKLNPFFETVFVKGKKYIGIVCIVTAVVHFIFPTLSIL